MIETPDPVYDSMTKQTGHGVEIWDSMIVVDMYRTIGRHMGYICIMI